MIATRVIPVLLWGEFGAVKGRQFDPSRRIGAMMDRIRTYEQREIDELILLDVVPGLTGRGPRFDEIRQFTTELFCPLTVGGGVRSVDDVRRLLAAGADKVAICTGAIEAPELVAACARKFGRQAIVGAVDVRGGRVFSHCGTQPANIDPDIWAKVLDRIGAGEILLTSIDRDGTLAGYDLDLIKDVAAAVSVPVVAAGGAGTYDHMVAALAAGAHAVAAGAMFCFTDATPTGARDYLAAAGYVTRQPSRRRA